MSRRRHTTFICDGCATEFEGQRPPQDWLTVTRGIDPEEGPTTGLEWWDFCSYACLAIWATHRAQKVNAN